MSEMDTVNRETFEDLPPLEFRGRAFDGCFSAESLLGSVVLHLAALFLVIVFAVDRSGSRHDAIVVDIGNITLPDQSAAATPTAAPVEAGQPESLAANEPVSSPDAVQIPAAETPANEEEPDSTGEAVAETDPASTPEPVAESAAVAPPFPEPSVPHQHGEYDPFEVYKAQVAQRVRDVTASSRDLPARTLFAGRMAVHLYLDPYGRHLKGPKICLGHSKIALAAPLPEHVARQHFMMLVREVVGAVTGGAPYPEAPSGVEVPEEMTYFIELGADQQAVPAG